MEEPLDIFKMFHLFSKEEVQSSFNSFMEHLKTSDEEGYGDEKKVMILELCERFKAKLDNCMLPKLQEHWWYYEYVLTNDGIELSLMQCEDMRWRDGWITSMSSTPQSTMLSVKCDYLNTEQYAACYGVSPVTVRQWIRRGKLRTAKKNGRDWLIPSIADKPKRGFESVTYSWEQLPEQITNEFPFLRSHHCISIDKDPGDKSRFMCRIGWITSDDVFQASISNQEREKLELALISADEVEVEVNGGMYVYTPDRSIETLSDIKE